MQAAPQQTARPQSYLGNLILLTLVSIAVGLVTGTICSLFRLCLDKAELIRGVTLELAQHSIGISVLVVFVVAALAAISAAMVHWLAPDASGSGIPHLEAVLSNRVPPAPMYLVPVKFIGGVLSIGAGLALGREGPSVQMGASTAYLLGKWCSLGHEDQRILGAGGAGAGLATAFNAPAAGSIFVLEELIGRFEPRIAVAALGSSVAAISVAYQILGSKLAFDVPDLQPGTMWALPVFLVFGIAIGFLGVFYNRSLLSTIDRCEASCWPVEARAALIGAAVGMLAVLAPHWVGGGDAITQQALHGTIVLAVIPVLLVVRLALGAFSYAAATPGGLFAPMLVLGSSAGLGFGQIATDLLPQLGMRPEAFAVVGMAAFFSATVRAPLTGIVLVTEMTGSGALILPHMLASFGAMLVSEAMRNAPIYEVLRKRTEPVRPPEPDPA